MNRILLYGMTMLLLTSSELPAQQPRTDRERELLERIEKLEQRISALEMKSGTPAVVTAPAVAPASPSDNSPQTGILAGTTLNAYLDGYYGYNFNRPIGRANLLRANDVLSNSFTLNQASLILERAPDVSAGRRLGVRVDLMFGQNTETMQGGAQNELRPQVYRNVYQAYGSYVAPIGSGLQADFGKFASSLGYETNYAKDQPNYSRSYFFNYLPYYHMGLRANYKLNDKVGMQYWLVNGANQTEDFNGFKSNAALLTLTPAKSVSWNINYYEGQEARDLAPVASPGMLSVPASPKPNGREHIFDTYASWNASEKLTLIGEADYVINRQFDNSSPSRVVGGMGIAKYQFTPVFNMAGRFEYLDDRGGLFSGTTQALKETTVTATYQPLEGFQFRAEFRRDFSNQPFFFTNRPNVLKREQDTATLGLVWWFGGKQGGW